MRVGSGRKAGAMRRLLGIGERSRAMLLALAAVLLLPAAAQAAPLGFAAPVYVDKTLAGGEPSVAYATKSGLLVYTSHEGTTHLFSSNIPGAPAESGGWIANYRNQVNIWTSQDNGASWQVVDHLAGFFTDPLVNTGFSDPDLTQDESGNIYNTGIDLANDQLLLDPPAGRPGRQPWSAPRQCERGLPRHEQRQSVRALRLHQRGRREVLPPHRQR